MNIFSLLLILSAILPSVWNLLQSYYYSKHQINVYEPQNKSQKGFSIIVAEKNESKKTIEGLIHNLLDINYEKYEIIIISDDPKEKFEEKYREYMNIEKLKILHRNNPVGGKAGALNYGVKHSKYEYLVFLDSDARVDKDFLSKLALYDFNVASYRLRIYNAETDVQRYYKEFTEKVMDSLFKVRYYLGLPIFPNGSAFCIRKDILIKVGGWKENIITEDLELGIRLFLHNYKIKYLDDIIVYSLAPFTLDDLYKQIERWSYGSAQLLLQSFKLFKKGIRGIEGVLYAQQWGIYGLFIFMLILLSSLNFILKIPLLVFILSIVVYGMSVSIYALVYKQKVNNYKLPLVILNASIAGYCKGLIRLPFKWTITPKEMEKEVKKEKIKVWITIPLLFSFLNIIFGNILPSIILLFFSIMESVV
ncbi:glycosyltransferase [Sulfurisphaera tokodaii]|uniref:Glycosyltransferase n=2 Tax=Sulfurisphaera tokodaii TaxID=111955 RepID=Q974Y9_SULTO|nr:glycosyltransferase family 2 protein [Sulfurisphaera tokodaii]BAB65518.1 putative glycosyltransferase [Sulfurisphaera tokodaii str. 7]HII74782.1 glycosyltransferase family 2 protein [Sulfurisphaera tokodaii]